MSEGATPKPQGNPAFQMMGLPKFRAKIPSKPWLVFIGLVSTWTGLIVYDRREKKRIQAYWCDRVSHLARQPFQPNQLPRKVTIYISTPPGDSISSARDYFKEYVKPVLVAAALDYQVVEGKKLGEIRWKVAERTRRVRRGEDDSEGTVSEEAINSTQANAKISREEGPGGIVVVGRHTWKEYVRGLHEGWLGSEDEFGDDTEKKLRATADGQMATGVTSTALDAPSPSPADPQAVVATLIDALPPGEKSDESPLVDAGGDGDGATEEKRKEEEKPPRKPQFPPPTISPSQYSAAELPPTVPSTFQPSLVVPFPHLLGFLNTPIRIQRYLTQRRLMDRVSREVAAIALGAYGSYSGPEEVIDACKIEETEWQKKWVQRVREDKFESDEKDPPLREKTVIEELEVDPRIVERMKKFVEVSDSDAGDLVED